MAEHLKNLLTALQSTMEQLAEYPDQTNDWLLSNFNYIKTDSPLLSTFLPKEYIKEIKKEEAEKEFLEKKQTIIKVKNDKGEEEEVLTQQIQSDDKTNGFFQRSEAVSSVSDKGKYTNAREKTEHIKALKRQIEREGAQSITNEVGLAAMISPQALQDADPDAVEDYQSLIEGDNIVSSLPSSDSDNYEDDEIPAFVLNMANKAKGGKNPYSNDADLAKMQKMREQVSKSRKNFESGENRGSGGFSRS